MKLADTTAQSSGDSVVVNQEQSDFELSEFTRRQSRLSALRAGLKPNDQIELDWAQINQVLNQLDQPANLPTMDQMSVSDSGTNLIGRIQTIRQHGKIIFFSIWIHTPELSRLTQVVAKAGETQDFESLEFLDLGDVIIVAGQVFVTHKGEASILIRHWSLAAKTLRPWPEKWHGLADEEAKLRQRYVSLAIDAETHKMFLQRSQLLTLARNLFQQANFLEVETPILTPEASGANAHPFKTHHQATKADWYLRIAPETYLKELIVGGIPRVFEVAKCFRNEGLDPTHLPEFTMIEYYAVGWNYRDNLKFTVNLIQQLCLLIHPDGKFTYEGQDIVFSGTWPEITYSELFFKYLDLDLFEVDAKSGGKKLKPRDFFVTLAEKHQLKVEAESAAGLVDLLYKKLIRPKLIQPLILTRHPAELKPLARKNSEQNWLVDSYQILFAGQEIVNAYSELADAVEQRARLEAQQAAKLEGDQDAMSVDESFLRALEHGMPATSGTGLGFDRLCALLFGQDNLRQVILFPLVKTKSN